MVAAQLKSMGYVVAFNKPYAGGFITEHYGKPSRRRHALQIEVNRALYMDESTYERRNGFRTVRDDIGRLAESMFEMIPALFGAPRAAAE
jgi:N-formylglutamate amidohydrolase